MILYLKSSQKLVYSKELSMLLVKQNQFLEIRHKLDLEIEQPLKWQAEVVKLEKHYHILKEQSRHFVDTYENTCSTVSTIDEA